MVEEHQQSPNMSEKQQQAQSAWHAKFSNKGTPGESKSIF